MRQCKNYILIWMTILVTGVACNKKYSGGDATPGEVSHLFKKMTDIMIHDVTNPPLASRFFAYVSLAGYEVVSQNNPRFKSMHGLVNDYPEIKKPAVKKYSYSLAAVFAMLETAGKLQPSGKLLDAVRDSLRIAQLQNGASEALVDSSEKYGVEVATGILKYAKEDGYRKISALQRYSVIEGVGYWYPTPPAYLPPVEPHFKTVRPFFLDSCSQFKPIPPTAFDSVKQSPFYKLMNDVYREGKNPTDEHRQIAAFWDCNPFAVQDNGHLIVGIKKMSPGAHWLGIAEIACRKSKYSFDQTMEIYAILSTTLMDAFICCWDEKYRSNRIRPETAIRRYIDPEWEPFLQTPPFPEYLSGHSVISTASAEVLTHFFGENLAYTDSTELAFGLPPRNFSSFRQAASEAAVSRFYGGIHFMDAIRQGEESGKKVGQMILQKLFREKSFAKP